MNSEMFFISVAERYLPPGAKLIRSEGAYRGETIQFEDLDNDGMPELIANYRNNGQYHKLILKKHNNFWYKLFDIEYMRSINLYVASIKTINGVKWGYINSSGELIIKPVYSQAYDFGDNQLAIVTSRELSGIINTSGKYVVEPKYFSINEFSEGLAVAFDKKGAKVIDEKGREIPTKAYDYISQFKDGRAKVAKTGSDGSWTYGYIDRQGKEVIPIKYKEAQDFKNGKAVVKVQDGYYAIIDLNGNILNTFKYAVVGNIGEGLLSFKREEEGKFGFIDENGNVIIPPKFSSAEDFSNGRAVVNMSDDYTNNYGLIDRKGNFVISPKYNEIQLLDEERLAVGIAIDKGEPYIGSKYAIGDVNGNLLTDFVYYGVSKYKYGLASAYNDTNTFFIDKTGKKLDRLPSVDGNGTLSIKDDLIRADVDMRISYLDKNGKVIWKQNTDIPLDNKYFVRELKYKPNRNYLVYYPEIVGMLDKKAEAVANNKLKLMSEVKPINREEQLKYSYVGTFDIEFFRKNLLVLNLSSYNYPFGAAHGMPTEIYPHVNLESGQFYELKDLFKKNSNYVKVLSDIIKVQIQSQGEQSMVWLDQYKGITANQPFYVTKDTLNIYFYPYEIAPYAAGFPTFKITYGEIMNIIDTSGSFWRSFN